MTDIETIRKASEIDNIPGEVLSELLMDDMISTHNMYGDLVDLYDNADDAGKNTIDSVLKILVLKNMKDIAKEILKRAKDQEEK